MKILFGHSSLRQVLTMLLLASLLNYLLLPIAVLAQQSSAEASPEAAYKHAEDLYNADLEKDAAKALEDLMGNGAYKNVDPNFKLKVSIPLVKCYYVEKNIALVKAVTGLRVFEQPRVCTNP